MLAQMRRPGLLVKAARLAADHYRREVQLAHLLGTSVLPRHGAAVLRLMEREAELDRLRREKAATYSPSRHVEVLSAVIAESRMMQPVAEAV